MPVSGKRSLQDLMQSILQHHYQQCSYRAEQLFELSLNVLACARDRSRGILLVPINSLECEE